MNPTTAHRPARKDGNLTKKRLLKAASTIFAEKGYKDANIADICHRAGANIAAVNYHFRNKENLYTEVLRYNFDIFMQAYPISGGLAENAAPEERLYALILALLHRPFDDGRLGEGFRLAIREMVSPTDIFTTTYGELVKPIRKQTRTLIRGIIGKQASEDQILYCEISIMNQCLSANFIKGRRKLLFGHEHLTESDLEKLARHITEFSLGGIRAIRDSFQPSLRQTPG